jgi:hypothetical protein
MTGGDTLTGRATYGRALITFAPSHKLVMVGNHKPEPEVLHDDIPFVSVTVLQPAIPATREFMVCRATTQTPNFSYNLPPSVVRKSAWSVTYRFLKGQTFICAPIPSIR